MNALQPIESPKVSPTKPKKLRHRHSKNNRNHRGVAVEISIKLLANGILSAAAIVASVKLIPYQISQQAKLQEIRLETTETEARVQALRQNFNRYFDPTQARKVMQEQNPRLSPNQRRIILTSP
jgi:cell division protein FtsB